MEYLKKSDPEIFNVVQDELRRQVENLELIASENFVSRAVMETMGSCLTNKYAEGYPYKREKNGEINWEKYGRYYGGCEYVDVAEKIAVERAREIFHADHVNVQPHSGSQANMAVYFSQLNPGDTILGMNLSHGGHLTHGSPVNFSGKLYNVVSYGVKEGEERIDFDDVYAKAKEHKPKMIVVGASAYPRIIDFNKFREIADEINAKILVDIAHIAGLIAVGLHPSPVAVADFVTTTTHKTLRGPRGGMVMCKEEYAKDIDSIVFPGIQGGPLMHVIAAKAVAFKEALSDDFKCYQKKVLENASVLADSLLSEGFRLVSGGTDNHLVLINLSNFETVSGKKMENWLGDAGITVNKNTVPFDTRKPFVTSGIRIGTPAITSRNMGSEEMKKIATLFKKVVVSEGNENILSQVKSEVQEMCREFPLYPELYRLVDEK